MRGKRRQIPAEVRSRRQRLAVIVDRAGVPEAQRLEYRRYAFELGRTMHRRPVADYERGTKLVVMRWFRRGLSGHRLWRIMAGILEMKYGKGTWSEEKPGRSAECKVQNAERWDESPERSSDGEE
ncbi:hypothetical protein FJY69_02750 [candidate division WOR-3 bacterium]|nr:hypothetical protein [candidate division WOR-3 bacterium]